VSDSSRLPRPAEVCQLCATLPRYLLIDPESREVLAKACSRAHLSQLLTYWLPKQDLLLHTLVPEPWSMGAKE
jgi:hypothetical protein